MGMTRFRQREIVETATREAMDVIQAKTVNANANTFEYFKVPASVAFAANDADFAMVA